MGCYYSKKERDVNEVDHSQFSNLVKKLSHQFKIQMDRLREGQMQLAEKFKKQVTQTMEKRQKYTELQTMEQIVYKRDLQKIYLIVFLECQKILTNNHSLSLLIKRKTEVLSEKSRKMAIKTPIQVILFAKDLINSGGILQKDNDLQRMQQLVKTIYTEVSPIQKCEEELINYYKEYRRPNKEQIKSWVLPFCSQQNISLSVINKVGHNFSY